VPTHDGLDDVCCHIGGMFGGEPACPLSDRRPYRVNDESLSHKLNLT
jgi:hypothetical protein